MQPVVDTSRTGTLMVCPYYFFAKVGDIETDLTHTINVRETVPPIVILWNGCVPVIIEVGLIVLYAVIGVFWVLHLFADLLIEVSAYVTIITH